MTDNTERAQVGWGFWLRWMLANTVVTALAVTVTVVGVGVAILFLIEARDVGIFHGAAFGGVFGTLRGFAQRLVLRRQVSWSGRWVLFSAAGGAAGFALAVAIIINLGSFESGSLPATVLGIVIVIGAALGIGQWFVLRREASGSGLWVLASAVGPALIYLVVFYVAFFALDRVFDHPVLRGNVADFALLIGAVGGMLGYGAITGGVMVWLLRQPGEAELRLALDRRTRTWLRLAAVILIVPMAGYFVFETIEENNNTTTRRNNAIAGLQVPSCSEVFVAPMIKDRGVTTCHIKRANCDIRRCYDGPSFENRSFFFFIGEPRLANFDGECLLVTGEVGMRGDIRFMFASGADVEICQ